MKPSVNRKNRWIAAALVLPGVLFVVFFMLIPLFSLCLTSFFPDEHFSLSSYFSLFGDVYFQQVFVRSLRLSLLSTAVCALLGFPTAYYIAKHSRHKGMMMAFAVFPMFTSPVIRSFSWMVILGKKGIVNSALVSLGIFAKPQSLLYNEFSMTVGFVQLFLPLMTGSVLVFTGCMTAYTTPQLLGGTDTRVLATMIYQYAMSLRDWTQASVVAVVMIVVTMMISGVFNALSRKINPMA